MINADDLYCMKRALEEARNCTPEDDRVHPRVGAAVSIGGRLINTAYRGCNSNPGAHAEYLLLEHICKNEMLAGATIYTTLEPCTTRNHPKMPCVERIIQRKIARVVIGTLDPNQAITGKGILRLRQANIKVELFTSELMSEIEDLNRSFIDLHRTPSDLMLPAWNQFKSLRELVPINTRDVVLIGQNLSSRLGLSLSDQEQTISELKELLERDVQITLILMLPSVLNMMHKEAAEDLMRFTLPALTKLLDTVGELSNKVKIILHPATTMSAIVIDRNFGYVIPKFQKTSKIRDRINVKLEPNLFDKASLERTFYDAERGTQGALILPLSQGIAELRSQLIACGIQPK